MPALELLPRPPGGQCPQCKDWLWFSHSAFNGGRPTHYECRRCKLSFRADNPAWQTSSPAPRSREPGEDDD